jgi:hypothetical protein
LVLKNLRGAAAETSKPLQQANAYVKQNVSFLAIQRIPNFSTNFSSVAISNYFIEISKLLEQEKALNAFIKKQDGYLKALTKP